MIDVEQHLKLVHHVIQRYIKCQPGHPNYEDMYQDGCYGLSYAAKHFNPDLGFQFSTYAVPHIMGQIRRRKRDDGLIHINRAMQDLISQYRHQQSHGYSDEEIMERMGITPEQLSEIIIANQPIEYLEYEVEGKEGTAHLQKNVADKVNIEEEVVLSLEIKEKLKIIKGLNKPYISEIADLFLKDVTTQTEIGKRINLSQAQVSRLLKQLREYVYPAVSQFYEGEINERQMMLKLNSKNKGDEEMSVGFMENIRTYIDVIKEAAKANKGSCFAIKPELEKANLRYDSNVTIAIRKAQRELEVEGLILERVGRSWMLTDKAEKITEAQALAEMTEKLLEPKKDLPPVTPVTPPAHPAPMQFTGPQNMIMLKDIEFIGGHQADNVAQIVESFAAIIPEGMKCVFSLSVKMVSSKVAGGNKCATM